MGEKATRETWNVNESGTKKQAQRYGKIQYKETITNVNLTFQQQRGPHFIADRFLKERRKLVNIKHSQKWWIIRKNENEHKRLVTSFLCTLKVLIGLNRKSYQLNYNSSYASEFYSILEQCVSVCNECFFTLMT